MSSAKQRHKHGSSDRSGQPAPGDVAKRDPKGSSSSRTEPAAHTLAIGKACHFLFYAALLSLAGFSGWCGYNLLAEVAEINRRQGDLSRQSGELAQSVEGALKQVHSLQITVGNIETILTDTKQRQEWTDTAVQHADAEVKRIDTILKKMQNEILKDLSDGIQDVKNARERDVPFFEKTVDEKLTDLTTSINDNIAVFTKVQSQSQNEISDIKKRIVSLEEAHSLENDLGKIKNVVNEIQTSMTSNKNAIDLLKNAVELVETSLYNKVREVGLLKEEHNSFNKSLSAQYSTIQALKDDVLKVEENIEHFPNDMEKINTDFQLLKDTFVEQEKHLFSEKQDIIDMNKNTIELFESRLRGTEESIESLNSIAAQQLEKIDSFIVGQDDLHRRVDTFDRTQAERLESENDLRSIQETVTKLTNSQEALVNGIEELKRHTNEKADELQKLQEEINSLHDGQSDQIKELQSNQGQMSDDLEQLQGSLPTEKYFEQLVNIQEVVSSLVPSVHQLDSNLQTLSIKVESMADPTNQIRSNEKKILAMQDSIEEIRSSLDTLLEKIEIMQEMV
ncbi:cytoskeleton-associated protein 4 [Lissotriton helveticus]